MSQERTADDVQNEARMSLAEKLESLARQVPGVAGYQQREACRETDKTVRLQLVAGLEDVKREIEAEQRELTEAHVLSHLAVLGRLTAKIDKLANKIKYAGRGYRGLFDTYKLTNEKLDRLYSFDLGLLDEIESLRTKVAGLRAVRQEEAAFSQAMDTVDRTLDGVEKTFTERSDILIT